MDFTRQSDVCDPMLTAAAHVDLVGAGGIGSTTGLLLTKLGVANIRVFDFDKVEPVNLASQLFRLSDVGQFKAVACRDVWTAFSDGNVEAVPQRGEVQDLRGIVILAVDSMAARAQLWEQVQRRPLVDWLIDGRMGLESGSIFSLRPGSFAERRWYEASLYDDADVLQLPCTGRSVIYNTAWIASLICRQVKRMLMRQPVERRIDFDLDRLSLVVEA